MSQRRKSAYTNGKLICIEKTKVVQTVPKGGRGVRNMSWEQDLTRNTRLACFACVRSVFVRMHVTLSFFIRFANFLAKFVGIVMFYLIS
jgi:hypothetical protein